VFFDDTCYLLPFEDATQAALVHALLCSEPVRQLLDSLKYPGAKRPITKKLLQRIDLAATLQECDLDELVESASNSLKNSVTEQDIETLAQALDPTVIDLAAGEGQLTLI